jgi:hypothetical protein
MKATPYLIVLLSIFLLCSCATPKPQLTRQDWLDMTQYAFKDTAIDKVLEAGEKVLRLADPSDVTIYHFPNKMVGSRKYFIYAVLAASFGSYNFDVTATQQGNDVLVQLYIGESSQPIMPVMTYTPGVQGGWQGMGATATTGPISIGTPIDQKAVYKLFFKRIESLLYNKPWISCEKAKELFSEKRSSLYALCLLADDNEPEK